MAKVLEHKVKGKYLLLIQEELVIIYEYLKPLEKGIFKVIDEL